jgi:hypothetical protein
MEQREYIFVIDLTYTHHMACVLFLDKRSSAPGSINMHPKVVFTDIHAQTEATNTGFIDASAYKTHYHQETTATKA